MVMLAFGAFMLIFCKVSVAKVPNGVVFKSVLVACIAIFGIAWMSNTYFQHAMPEFKVAITDMVNTSMDFWFRALCCICGCKLTGSYRQDLNSCSTSFRTACISADWSDASLPMPISLFQITHQILQQ